MPPHHCVKRVQHSIGFEHTHQQRTACTPPHSAVKEVVDAKGRHYALKAMKKEDVHWENVRYCAWPGLACPALPAWVRGITEDSHSASCPATSCPANPMQVNNEKKVMIELLMQDNPFLVGLLATGNDKDNLYMLLELCTGGWWLAAAALPVCHVFRAL